MPFDGASISPPKTVLVDRRNFAFLKPALLDLVSKAGLTGLDIETHDADRHDGLNRFMRCDEDGRKAKNKKLVFDTRRTTVTGLSIYPDGADYSFYFNLAHADIENRLRWDEVKEILDARPEGARWVIHNAAFERVMLAASLGYEVTDYICTMQLCVSAYGPDNYDLTKFYQASFEPLRPLLGAAQTVFATHEYGKEKNSEQQDLFNKIVAKESDASYSYNGLVDSISWGYGLKKAVKSWFGYQMSTFDETLGENVHMGQLTGDEVAEYGAEDAFWCVKLYHRVLQHMLETNPATVKAYFEQELPAIEVFADMWRQGWRLNHPAVEAKRHEERANTAKVLRELRVAVRALLPFSDDLHERLMKEESWYRGKANNGSGGAKKRKQIETWAALDDAATDFEEVTRVAGSMSEGWAGVKNKGALNLSYWQTTRGLIYDLCQEKPIVIQGKVQSDADARGKVVIRLQRRQREEGTDESAKLAILHCLSQLAGIEQRSKLYIEPYLMLVDPETGRVYPTISSLLATRRMAMSTPNGQQLAKRGESVWVRGFFLADDDEELQVSMDWSAIELVTIGEMSGDPEFKKAFGQLPYDDLHTGAAADALSVVIPEMNEELLRRLNKMAAGDIEAINPRILMNRAGEKMEPGKAKSYWRTEVGKGSNFNYWYSGALSTVGERLGWTPDQMWEATDKYRQRFQVGEAWRVGTIEFAKRHGYVQLPDGHRRDRFEATDAWTTAMRMKFSQYLQRSGPDAFFAEVLRSIQRRANNQAVNAMIQGTCAALMKRTLARLMRESRATGWFRLIAPIHDEVVASVKRRHLLDYIRLGRSIMCDHLDLFPTLPLHNTVSVGRTFEPFNEKKSPFGQIELDEAPRVPWIPERFWEKVLPDSEVERVADYLMGAKLVA